jgi:hypothetical protein
LKCYKLSNLSLILKHFVDQKTKLKIGVSTYFTIAIWAGNSEKIISVIGFIVYLMNLPFCWISKAQRGVTLSSSKAEYVAIGAMFMAQNASSCVRTRHIDTHYHVRENLEEGIINIELVKSIENDSDIFTKNVSQEVYDKHVTKFLGVHTEENKHWSGMEGCWRYIPHVHIILDISLRLSNWDNLQRYCKEFSST